MLDKEDNVLIVDILPQRHYLSGAVRLIVKVGVKMAKFGLVPTFSPGGLSGRDYKWLRMKWQRWWLRKLWLRGGRPARGHKTFKHSAQGLKLFVKLGIICILLLVKFVDRLLYSLIHVSGRKIIVGNKCLKVGNCLLKKNGGDFPRIAIEADRRSLCGPCLPLRRGTRGRLNKTIWGQDMIENPLGVRVNLRVFGVVGVLLELGYTTGRLKNIAGRCQQWKGRRNDA